MTTARFAGGAMFVYYAAALGDMAMFSGVAAGAGVPARLANIAAHSGTVRLTVVLEVLTIICAITLAATLYRLTRSVSDDLALIAFGCRLLEGVLNAVSPAARVGLLSLATNGTASEGLPEVQAAILFKVGGLAGPVSGTVFAVGSALFAYLLLKGRSIPAPIARVGLAGSLLVLPVYLLSGFRLVGGRAVWLSSLPLIGFELVLGAWLVVRGVQPSSSEGQ